MSIVHDGQTFAGDHGKMQYDSPELRLQVTGFPAVNGESHIIGKPGGRNLSTSYTVSGFSTATLLDSHLTAINLLIGQLTGTVIVGSPFGGAFGGCTFLGFDVAEQFFDGSGVHGWVARGRLRWRQRIPAS